MTRLAFCKLLHNGLVLYGIVGTAGEAFSVRGEVGTTVNLYNLRFGKQYTFIDTEKVLFGQSIGKCF